MMTVDQVADYLQLNRLTVYRYVRGGDLPASKIGKVYRIRREDVEAFLEGHRVPKSPDPDRTPATRAVPSPQPRIRSVWVRDIKSPDEISVRPTRRGPYERPEWIILNGDPLEVVRRGLH